MKKLLYLLLILPLLSISCSSDNDTDTNADTENYSNSDLVGAWVLDSIRAKVVITDNDSATQAIKDLAKWDFTDEPPITFALDGTINTFYNGDSLITGTYSISGNKLNIKTPVEDSNSEISIRENILYEYIDETEIYKDEFFHMYPNWKNVVISKVITTNTYKRQ